MATRSTIAIQNTDGTVTGIYCHWDGYLSNNGVLLNTHYNTEERVRELLALGDLSSLAPEIGEKHPFSEHEMSDGETWDESLYRNWCSAYGRDRGETNTEARTLTSWQDWLENMAEEFNYLFVPDQGWSVQYWDNSTQRITVAMLSAEYEL